MRAKRLQDIYLKKDGSENFSRRPVVVPADGTFNTNLNDAIRMMRRDISVGNYIREMQITEETDEDLNDFDCPDSLNMPFSSSELEYIAKTGDCDNPEMIPVTDLELQALAGVRDDTPVETGVGQAVVRQEDAPNSD